MDTTSDDYSTDGCMTDSSSDSDSSGDEGEHSKTVTLLIRNQFLVTI